jgi:hypothetical protein
LRRADGKALCIGERFMKSAYFRELVQRFAAVRPWATRGVTGPLREARGGAGALRGRPQNKVKYI